MAALSFNFAGEEAIHRWLRENAPTGVLWSAALEPHGYQEVTDLNRLHPILRTLAAPWDDRNSAWISENLSWIAVHSGDAQESSQDSHPRVRVFARTRMEQISTQELSVRRDPARKTGSGRLRKPKEYLIQVRPVRWPAPPQRSEWNLAGIGWLGLEEVLRLLASAHVPEPDRKDVPESRVKRPDSHDPRSIQY